MSTTTNRFLPHQISQSVIIILSSFLFTAVISSSQSRPNDIQIPWYKSHNRDRIFRSPPLIDDAIVISSSFSIAESPNAIIHSDDLSYLNQFKEDEWLSTSTTLQRFLSNDFTELNNVLSGVTFAIPDMATIKMDLPWPFSAVNITVTNFECFSTHLGDITLTSDEPTNQKLEVFLNIMNVDVDCSLNWKFQYDSSSSIMQKVGSDGTAQIYFRNSNLAISSAFLSDDYQNFFPNTSTLESCTSNFAISDMTFDGSISATIANTFEQTVRGTVESNINNIICRQLNDASTEVTVMLGKVHDTVQKFLPSSSNWTESDVDPLQTSMVIDKNTTLVDFSTGTVIGELLTQIDSFLYVGPDTIDPSNSGINSLIRSNFLNSGDDAFYYYDVPVDQFFTNSTVFEGEDSLTKSLITMNSLRIVGLDTFTKFTPPSPIAPQILQSSFVLNQLQAVADLTVTMNPSTLSNSLLVGNSAPPVVENITVTFDMANIEATVSFFLAMSMNQLSDLQLGSILHSNQISPCLLQLVDGAEVTQFIAHVGNISTPIMTGFISTGMDRVIANATQASFQALQEWILKSIPGFFQKTVRRSVNNGLQNFLAETETCAGPTLEGQGPFVDFRDLLLSPEQAAAAGASGKSPYGDIGVKLMQLVDEHLLAQNPVTGLSLINDNVIAPYTLSQSNTSGTILIKRDFINNNFKIDIPGLKANVRLRVSDARLNNLNSVNAVTLLSPSVSDGHYLDNDIVIGTNTNPLQFEMKILLKITGDDINVKNEFVYTVSLNAAQIRTALMAMVDTKSFLTFPLRDIKNPYCWLATIPPPQLDAFGLRLKNATTVTASVVGLSASVQNASFGVNCISCTSPGLRELDNELKTQEGSQETTKLVNNAFIKLEQVIQRTFLQVQIDRILNEAPMRCPHQKAYNSSFTQMQYEQMMAPNYTDNSGNFVLAVAITVGIFVLLGIIVLFVANFIASRKHRKWLLSLSNKELKYLHMQQVRQSNLQKGLNTCTSAMYNSNDIPEIARYVMPIVVLLNIALFISGHLSLGATVDVDITLQGQRISISNFFDFSIAHSIKDMWEGGARVMAVLLCILSGLWPYVKQIIVLVMWFLPPRLVSVQFRGKMFHWLDTLGKWSVIDIYVLVFTMVAFRLSIESPGSQASFLSSLYSVEVMIIPKWGLYAMMIAQLISHVSSHFLLHFHRKIVDAGSKRGLDSELSQSNGDFLEVPTEKVENVPLCECKPINERDSKIFALRHGVFEVDRTNKRKKMVVRSWIDFVLVLAGLVATVLFILGCVLPSFHLDNLGLVGIAVELGQAGANAMTQYSVFHAVSVLLDLAKYLGTIGNWVGLVSLSLLVIFSTCLVPVLQVILILSLWFIPMNPLSSKRKKFLLFVEILQAWQYVEVYLVALLIATWQIGGISEFFFNDLVGGSVKGVLGSMVYYGILSPENAQMFYVVASLESGAYILLAGACFLQLLSKFIMLAEKQQTEQLLKEIRNNDKIGRQMRAEIDDCGDYIENYRDIINDVKYIPMQFTDYFKLLIVTSSHTDMVKQEHQSPLPHPLENPTCSPSSLELDSESIVLCPLELGCSLDDFMVSSLSSFDYETTTSVSLELIRPRELLSPPHGKDEIASFGD